MDADSEGLSAKTGTMIDRKVRLVLPLMYHLVQEGLENLSPAMAAKVPAADHDEPGLVGRGDPIVPQSAPEPPRHDDRDGLQAAAEAHGVVLGVIPHQLGTGCGIGLGRSRPVSRAAGWRGLGGRERSLRAEPWLRTAVAERKRKLRRIGVDHSSPQETNQRAKHSDSPASNRLRS
jgi:hypothetical protein